MILTKEYFDERIEILTNSIANLSSDIGIRMNELKRQKSNKKENIILEQLRVFKKMDVTRIQRLIGSSRNWALVLMKRISNEHPEFQFILGDKQRKIPSILIYDASRTDFNLELKMKKLLSNGSLYSFSDFSKKLNLDLFTYLNKFRDIANSLVNTGEYEMIEGNKIHLIKS